MLDEPRRLGTRLWHGRVRANVMIGNTLEIREFCFCNLDDRHIPFNANMYMLPQQFTHTWSHDSHVIGVTLLPYLTCMGKEFVVRGSCVLYSGNHPA